MSKTLIRIIMPSEGDMRLVSQDGGAITLEPTYFAGECSGPVVQFVSPGGPDGSGEKVSSSYRVKIRNGGELRLAKADPS